ncbi:MAG: transcriptional regulator [Actinobacteria bacterium]|uniref:Unannotated protein n=1 Tax=freshwater metagenome TaxID=449393 RepID=A0A6J6SJ42_9ZZZZ|nr:transcriptional regulator [Actinomycetota bacterium]
MSATLSATDSVTDQTREQLQDQNLDQRSERFEQRTPGCSIEAALEIVRDRWTILILRDSFRGIRRFDDLRKDLEIPRAILADRLRSLVEHGVLVKRQYQQRPERFEYRLTPMGMELSPILVSLMQWGDRWLSGDEGPPRLLVHEPCSTEIDMSFYCWTCEEAFSPSQISSRPGGAES